MSPVPSRRGALARAFGWSGLCLGVLVGLPAWLVLTWGWPPPTLGLGLRLVGWSTRSGPGAGVGVVDVLVWASWIGVVWFAAAVAVELTQAFSGHTPRRVFGLGPAQGLAARAVGAILLFRALSGAAGAAPAAPAGLTAHHLVAPAPAVDPAVEVLDPARPAPAPPVEAVATPTPAPGGPTYVVVRGDTLWGIAASRLGDPLRWPQMAALNYGRPQPDGRALTSAHWIFPGWVLVLPGTTPGAAPPRSIPAASQPPPAVAPVPATAPPAPAAGRPGAPVPSPDAPAPTASPSPNGSGRRVEEPASRPGDPVPAPARAGLAAAGIIATVEALRRVQQRHRRAGRRIRLPDARGAAAEARLRRSATTGDSNLVDAGARALGAALVEAGSEVPTPATLAVGDGVLEVTVGTSAGEPPEGFGSWPGTWTVNEQALTDRAGSAHPWPALVSVGVQGERSVLVNLEAAGTLSVDGEPGAVACLVRAMAAELATASWAATIDLVLVGFDEALGPAQRARRVASLSEAVTEVDFRRAEADRQLSEAGHASFAAARLAEGGDAWAPTVVLSLRAPGDDEVAALCVAAPRGGPVAVVAPGLVGAAWLVELSGSEAVLEPVGMRLAPVSIEEEEWAEAGELLAVAADTSDVAAGPETDCDIAVGVAGGVGEIDLREPEAATGNGDRPVDALDVEATTASSERAEAAAAGSLSDGPVVWPPEPEVVVLLLGPLDLRGQAVEPRRGKYIEVIARLAIAERPVSTDELVTDLWTGAAAQSTVDTNVSRARDVLGARADGTPRISRTRGWGDRELDDSVRSDWWLFRYLAQQGTPGARRAALELIRGRPFEGLRAEWPSRYVPHMCSVIVDVAEAAAADCLDSNDPAGARRATRKGLLVAEYEERLWRPLMRAAHAESGVAAMEAVFEECARTLEVTVEPFDSLQPETVELYRRLGGRRRSSRPERSAARSG